MATVPSSSLEEVSGGVLTVMEAATLLHCSKRTIYRMVDEGLLIITRPRRAMLIPRRAVERHLAKMLVIEINELSTATTTSPRAPSSPTEETPQPTRSVLRGAVGENVDAKQTRSRRD